MEGSSTNTDSKMKTAQVAAILTCWVVGKNILSEFGSRNLGALKKHLNFNRKILPISGVPP